MREGSLDQREQAVIVLNCFTAGAINMSLVNRSGSIFYFRRLACLVGSRAKAMPVPSGDDAGKSLALSRALIASLLPLSALFFLPCPAHGQAFDRVDVCASGSGRCLEDGSQTFSCGSNRLDCLPHSELAGSDAEVYLVQGSGREYNVCEEHPELCLPGDRPDDRHRSGGIGNSTPLLETLPCDDNPLLCALLRGDYGTEPQQSTRGGLSPDQFNVCELFLDTCTELLEGTQVPGSGRFPGDPMGGSGMHSPYEMQR